MGPEHPADGSPSATYEVRSAGLAAGDPHGAVRADPGGDGRRPDRAHAPGRLPGRAGRPARPRAGDGTGAQRGARAPGRPACADARCARVAGRANGPPRLRGEGRRAARRADCSASCDGTHRHLPEHAALWLEGTPEEVHEFLSACCRPRSRHRAGPSGHGLQPGGAAPPPEPEASRFRRARRQQTPSSRPRRTASTRRLTPYLRKIPLRCVFTVFADTKSSAAISSVEHIWASSSRTCVSRSVSGSSTCSADARDGLPRPRGALVCDQHGRHERPVISQRGAVSVQEPPQPGGVAGQRPAQLLDARGPKGSLDQQGGSVEMVLLMRQPRLEHPALELERPREHLAGRGPPRRGRRPRHARRGCHGGPAAVSTARAAEPAASPDVTSPSACFGSPAASNASADSDMRRSTNHSEPGDAFRRLLPGRRQPHRLVGPSRGDQQACLDEMAGDDQPRFASAREPCP